MNDRLSTKKVVVEKVRKFICVTPLVREFPISSTVNKPLSECLSGIHLLLLGAISEEALITPYFGTIETQC